MANIPISDIETSAETLENEDLILVSKKSGSNYTSAKMTGTKLKTAIKSSIPSATTSDGGLMSPADKEKLDGIEPGAEVNQNAFSNVKVGSTIIAADSKSDTLTLVAGNNVTLTPDTSGDSITISSSGGGTSDGDVKGPSSSIADHIATFSGTTGKIIKDSGFTVSKSVPSDAKFTDTTYSRVTTSSDGLCPKLPNTTSKFLCGDGNWVVPGIPNFKGSFPNGFSTVTDDLNPSKGDYIIVGKDNGSQSSGTKTYRYSYDGTSPYSRSGWKSEYEVGQTITIDDQLSDSSTNPVQNKVVKSAIDSKASTEVATTSANGLMSSTDKLKLDNMTSITKSDVTDAITEYGTAKTSDLSNLATTTNVSNSTSTTATNITNAVNSINSNTNTKIGNLNNVSIDQITTAITNNNANITNEFKIDGDISLQIARAAAKSNFIDYSSSFSVKSNQTIESESFPFDCVLTWIQSFNNSTYQYYRPVLVNGISIKEFSISSVVPDYISTSASSEKITGYIRYKYYLEKGNSLFREKSGSSSSTPQYIAATLDITPLAYGEDDLEYKTYSLTDFLPDSEKYSEISPNFSEISIKASDGPNATTATTVTSIHAIPSDAKYWQLRLIPNDAVIICGGGSTKRNIYRNMYRTYTYCGNSYQSTMTAPRSYIDKRKLSPVDRYISINFNYFDDSGRIVAPDVSLFNNIYYAVISGITIS